MGNIFYYAIAGPSIIRPWYHRLHRTLNSVVGTRDCEPRSVRIVSNSRLKAMTCQPRAFAFSNTKTIISISDTILIFLIYFLLVKRVFASVAFKVLECFRQAANPHHNGHICDTSGKCYSKSKKVVFYTVKRLKGIERKG